MIANSIPFFKYTCYGNNFVILDELLEEILTEPAKSRFAYKATNACFGIGSDNLLFIQPYRTDVMARINSVFNYWQEPPSETAADLIFRMFEPDGTEAFCCGNGLLCIADYLYQRHRVTSSHIATEIPLGNQNIVHIGKNESNDFCWVNMGYPRPLPIDLYNPSRRNFSNDNIGLISDMKISFRHHDLSPFSDDTSLQLSGHLIFTGEPHLVLFINENKSLRIFEEVIFSSPASNLSVSSKIEKRANFGSWLLHHIGYFINNHYQNLFPKGLNVNIARVHGDSGQRIEYRCFERGIERETLACGTGALATAYVASKLNFVREKVITVLPSRCRWYEPEAQLQVTEGNHGWILNGNPQMLFQGDFKSIFAENQRTARRDSNEILGYQSSNPSLRLSKDIAETPRGLTRQARILLIEDNPKDVKLMKAHLHNEPYHLLTAGSGQEAIEILARESVDLIILDVMLPDESGYEMCKRIRKNESTRLVPVIFTTSLNDIEHKVKGIEVESDGYLTKPIDGRELRAQIKTLFKKKKQLERLLANHEGTMLISTAPGGHLTF